MVFRVCCFSELVYLVADLAGQQRTALGVRGAVGRVWKQVRDAESQHEKQRSVLSMQARDRRPVSQRNRLRPECAVYCLSANGYDEQRK